VDGKSVDTVAKLVARLDEKKGGDTVKLMLLRDGKQAEVGARLKAAG
jgi:S1-C subfamily serine protease